MAREHQERAGGAEGTRLGPRPLALHLAIAAMTWLSSRDALPPWNGALPMWKPELRPQLRQLEAALEGAEPGAFAAALDGQIRGRFERLAAGIQNYRRHPYGRVHEEPPVLWEDGTTRLLDYRAAGSDGPTVLVIPSLINRAYILDLMPERSLLRSMAAGGVRPLLVDWGAPGELERGFTLTDYIAGRLEPALDAARAGGPAVALGYCMGGLLAIALAARRRAALSGLVCLATPWDFHAERPAQAKLIGAAATLLEPVLSRIGELPVDAIQALFTGIDPLRVIRKFVAFADIDAGAPQARMFVAVEDWLNDGVPLAAPAARECLADWYGANTPASGAWRVAGDFVRPAALDLPALVVLPGQDRIVPPASAAALAAALPSAEVLRPAAGHIGMVVGAAAADRLYRPLIEWLRRR